MVEERRKRKKKKREKEICPSLLLCTIAIHAFGVYVCLLSLYEEHIERERENKKIKKKIEMLYTHIYIYTVSVL